jgi:hypothetical protein
MEQRFEAKLVGRGPGLAWVFLSIPFDVQEVFGSKARVPVAGTLNGFPFQNSLLPNGDGTHSMPVNKELLAGARAAAGDTVAVVMALDTTTRTVAPPEDFEAAMRDSPAAEQAFARLAYSHKKEYVDWIVDAKKAETRARRIEKALAMLAEGKRLKS